MRSNCAALSNSLPLTLYFLIYQEKKCPLQDTIDTRRYTATLSFSFQKTIFGQCLPTAELLDDLRPTSAPLHHRTFLPTAKLLHILEGMKVTQKSIAWMPNGGPTKRLTYLGVNTAVMGWTHDGTSILFSSDHEQAIDRIGVAYSIPSDGGMPTLLPIGPAMSISVTSGNRTVVGRNNNDPARWKRYKGGTAGDIWVDATGSGQFRALSN